MQTNPFVFPVKYDPGLARKVLYLHRMNEYLIPAVRADEDDTVYFSNLFCMGFVRADRSRLTKSQILQVVHGHIACLLRMGEKVHGNLSLSNTLINESGQVYIGPPTFAGSREDDIRRLGSMILDLAEPQMYALRRIGERMLLRPDRVDLDQLLKDPIFPNVSSVSEDVSMSQVLVNLKAKISKPSRPQALDKKLTKLKQRVFDINTPSEEDEPDRPGLIQSIRIVFRYHSIVYSYSSQSGWWKETNYTRSSW